MGYTIYTNPYTRVPEIWSVIPTVTGLSFLSVAVRFFIRKRLRGGLWVDDWTIGVASLLSIGLAIDLLLQIPYGYGSHVYDLPRDLDLATAQKFLYLGQLLYYLCVGIAKISILLFYLRLTDNLRIPVFAVLAFVSASTFGMAMSSILQCVPVSSVWNPTVKGHCIDRPSFWIATGGLNIFSDLLVYVLPIPTLWRAKMQTRQRIAVLLVFGVGFFVVIAGILKLNILRAKILTDDPTWDNVAASLWSVVECNVGIMCACMPSMKPVLGRILSFSGSTEFVAGDSPQLSAAGNPRIRRRRSPDGTIETTPSEMERSRIAEIVEGSSSKEHEIDGDVKIASESIERSPSRD